MALKGQSQIINLISKNWRIKICHYHLKHASNVRIIRVTALVNDINLYRAKYNPIKVFIDSKDLEDNINSKDNTINKSKLAQNPHKIDIEAALTFKTFKLDLVINLTLKSNQILGPQLSTQISKALYNIHDQ